MRIRCLACQQELAPEESRCPACGSFDREIDQVFDDGVGIESSIDLKARHGERGQVKPHLKKTIKREYSSTRRQWEEVERTFDSDGGTYVEEYRDLETGEVVWSKEAPIGDQTAHGRRARPTAPTTAEQRWKPG